ncbi:MG2 domain-containing protein [Variovorax dokdonensis]|uniref:MG2 domain-containing protein n=1 Tax=Variovorax dokdonensis TaxID=344883 RepID=A0ABT7NDY1_9BURK|nr:MG2 domain-containing protein [Variovorax dokdonensis]MDM0046148.1 MG2 domain-containing protein [Variovorax dokdonensis]
MSNFKDIVGEFASHGTRQTRPYPRLTVRRGAGKCLLATLALLAGQGALALKLTQVSPRGEVAQVNQVVATFDAAAVRLGNAKAPDPLEVTCDNAEAARGTGRWTSERRWVFDFERPLPPGVRCTVSTRADFRATGGEALPAATSRFQTGGPAVVNRWPYGGQIEEDQAFLLELNGPATPESLDSGVWCAVEGIGEQVPVRRLDDATRKALADARGIDAKRQTIALQCKRTLPAGAKVQLVWGSGVQTPSGVPNKVERRFDYKVREPFAAEFSCERENARAGCLPIRPMTLRFNAPVPRAMAEQARLAGGDKAREPKIDEGGGPDDLVSSLQFAPPFAEKTNYRIELPADFKDASGRSLASAQSFPMTVATGAMPPLAKFSAAPFGVIERLAEPDGQAYMPITVRRVENDLQVRQLADLQVKDDAEIIRWSRLLPRYDSGTIARTDARRDSPKPLPPPRDKDDRNDVETRVVSLLDGRAGVRQASLPKLDGNAERPFEVIGVPLAPGFHVLEVASPLLGQSLLDPRYGEQRTMYVRTSALVTNLAVHFKQGRENAMAWVTSLDRGAPVAGAQVRVLGCDGKEAAAGRTDEQGRAMFASLSGRPPACPGADEWEERAWFVSARAADDKGVQDMAFVWSNWQRGIESWRFNFPTSTSPQADVVAHTVFDRSLLRAGQTVSMKHFLRSQTAAGFGLPSDRPQTLAIIHEGSDQEFTQPLKWRKTGSGGLSAESSFTLPASAKLGSYRVELRPAEEGEGEDDGMRTFQSGSFRVEDFRLPVLSGRIGAGGDAPLIAPESIDADVHLQYVAGGAAGNMPVKVSAMVRPRMLQFADYEAYSFSPPRKVRGGEEADSQDSNEARVIADALALDLNAEGDGRTRIAPLPKLEQTPRELVLEATYADPSGEIQTLRSNKTLWPAEVIAGVRAESWISVDKALPFQALALDLSGKPRADVPIEVKAVARITTSSRKRLVGGFYSYDNHTEVRQLGTVCSGRSNALGLLECKAKLETAGEVELVAIAKDGQGRTSAASTGVYVTRQGELWFGGEDHDRMDVLPEKKSYKPGETARFQVRSPYRHATALVTVEREGVLDTQVVHIDGDDPTVSLKIKPEWGPNVYVGVLALRGRLYEVPWYSFFTWGWRKPLSWWQAYREAGKDYTPPTAMVDLSKPSFRFGAAEINVGTDANRIQLALSTDQARYQVRGQAVLRIRGTLPGGAPAAGAEVAVAAVDEALLELQPNTSWNLLDALMQRRSWGVETSTAQMEIVGRRHYGKKAAPPGGGGGKKPTRELLDTLLLWQPRIVLDAQGQAEVRVPLNDALTSFRLVAIADSGASLFGTGQTSIQTTQDLQIISGLPPLVREEDRFRAQFTLRNTTDKPMKVKLAPRATLLTLSPQTIDLGAGQSQEVAWEVTAPAQLARTRAESILWEIEAEDTLGKARDALKIIQRILPSLPLTVQQGTLVQLANALGAPFQVDVAPPPGALADNGQPRGGLQMSLQPRLADGLPGVRDWFLRYPYSCLEQKSSIAFGLQDVQRWQKVVADMPAYLDRDGLPNYFPPRDGDSSSGSDTLAAYLLSASDQAAKLDARFALPPELRRRLEDGLVAFVEGRLERKFWSPRSDLDVRKLAAIEALSRHGRASGAMITSITIAPNQWPTGAVIDWLQVLQRVKDVPRRTERLEEVQQILRARLSYQGTRLLFADERGDDWWWLMTGADVNAARLLLAVMDDPAWRDDVGRLATGLIGRQTRGAWQTTTANVWGSLALARFSALFEREPVEGRTLAELRPAGGGNAQEAMVDWRQLGKPAASPVAGTTSGPTDPGMFLPWPKGGDATLQVRHNGGGQPWLTLQATAAVPLAGPLDAGLRVRRSVTPVQQARTDLPPGRYSRGDVLRVTLDVTSSTDLTWVVLSDPVPGGATVLGGGLGRDSQIATQGEKSPRGAWPVYEERSFEAYRAYYDYFPKGSMKVEYTLRLNNAGDFALPPTRIEAMYAPEIFGMSPNARVQVEAGK